MNKNLLYGKRSKFYHAANLRDFSSYIKEGGILSRNRLENGGGGFTEFFTDQKDKYLGVWDKTFGNLNDFSKYFWGKLNSVPNAYGPITFVMNEKIWLDLPDVRITDKTVTSAAYRELEDSDIDSVFIEINGKFYLRKGYTGCEASTTLNLIPFDRLAYVLVDPLEIEGKSLVDVVRETASPVIRSTRIKERSVEIASQMEIYERLLRWSISLKGKLLHNNESLEQSLPGDLREWFYGLDGVKKKVMASWLTYTYNGTLSLFE